jgi:hypothetical protein
MSSAPFVQIRDNRTVTIKTFFSSALDTSSAADHPSKLSSANRLRALAQHTWPAWVLPHSTFRRVLKVLDAFETPDGQGYYGFHRGFNAYYEVIDYTKMLRDAKNRNRIFFEKLNNTSNHWPNRPLISDAGKRAHIVSGVVSFSEVSIAATPTLREAVRAGGYLSFTQAGAELFA